MLKLNMNKLKAVKRRLKSLDGTKLQVGFFAEDRYDDTGIPVAEVAMFNEFGTYRSPARPFMNDTFESSYAKTAIKHGLTEVFKAAIKGQAMQHKLRQLGERLVEIMQATIDAYPGSKSAATILRKGFNDPLYDTGKMIESVKFQIA
ncbi:hypothetical protein ACSFE6_04740 [Pseudomonas baetica]|uniref:hypothetical protein n=1 Tax=Pseudomonas baetica TaxID=674054 RepID=UPI003EEC0703